jgi:multisubunit Na+/H+ antiporter MnhE subunit
MSLFLVNVLLALVWTAVTGSFSFLNFAFGFVLAIFRAFADPRAGRLGRLFFPRAAGDFAVPAVHL